jgi:hypothetical protein
MVATIALVARIATVAQIATVAPRNSTAGTAVI